jgi:hypothetical protein
MKVSEIEILNGQNLSFFALLGTPIKWLATGYLKSLPERSPQTFNDHSSS